MNELYPNCDKPGCGNRARWHVWDGPHGLSPVMNEYARCNEHKPELWAFEHVREIKPRPGGG